MSKESDKTTDAPALWGSTRAYKIVRFSLAVFCAIGIGIMLYPMALRLKFAYESVHLADQYKEVVENTDGGVWEQEWLMAQEYNRARAYNRVHYVNTIADPFAGDDRTKQLNDEYWSLVNLLGNGMMGYIDIPRIGQRLNIYHGTDEDALLLGIGHIQGTSLPVGGEGTHCVLSGHRGLPGAKILTDLDQVKQGDLMLLHVLNHSLAYEVDQILEVEPKEISALEIVPNQDLLTLVTCTPYAVNTHRLLVRGHSVPYVETPNPVADGLTWLTPVRIAIILSAVVVVALVVAYLLRKRKKNLSSD